MVLLWLFSSIRHIDALFEKKIARLQTAGVDLSTPTLSLLEGQKRPVLDIELKALADILEVPVDWLLGNE